MPVQCTLYMIHLRIYLVFKENDRHNEPGATASIPGRGYELPQLSCVVHQTTVYVISEKAALTHPQQHCMSSVIYLCVKLLSQSGLHIGFFSGSIFLMVVYYGLT